MKRLMEYIRPHFGIMGIGLAIKFFASMMDLVIPSVLEKIIDDVVPQKNVRLIFCGAALWCCVQCCPYAAILRPTGWRHLLPEK